LSHTVIRVSQIRSASHKRRGGVIFSGRAVSDSGEIIEEGTLYVVVARHDVIDARLVEPGQWWRVAGDMTEQVRIVNNYKYREWQVAAVTAELVRPSGQHLIALMADSPAFAGVGMVKARRLWERFGERFYELLDTGDVDTLSSVLTVDVARQAVAAWTRLQDTKTLQWLHTHGFSAELGKKLIAFFGKDTSTAIEEDPYRLLSFCAGWREVDLLALDHFKVGLDDRRRLRGAVEEALYRVIAAGNTATSIYSLKSRLAQLLGSQRSSKEWQRLVSDVIDEGPEHASFTVGPTGLIHPVGPLVMEMTIAGAIADRLREGKTCQLLTSDNVETVIAEYESTLSYTLTLEQKAAVQLAAAWGFAIVVGGAGVGKTTMLKTLYQVYDAAGVTLHQIALAGSAARRMSEVTGRPASTIAAFLQKVNSVDLTRQIVIVVDDASVLDVITMSKLCEALPPHVRILLAGDSSQLMPVGLGLILPALVDIPGMPVVELTAVKRYGSLIASAAQDVRAGRWPNLSTDLKDSISFLPCKQDGITNFVVSLYGAAPAETKILCAKRSGPDGAKAINYACQVRYTHSGEHLAIWNEEFEQQQGTALYLHDLVTCNRNRWDVGIQNGSLGRIVSIEEVPFIDPDDNELGNVLGSIKWDDGVVRPLYESMLDELELGYGITVHKAQGSQWPIVIVPLTANRVLDRTLIYAAITCARTKVILVGDPAAAKAAVEALPKSYYRQTGLKIWLAQALAV